jgi:ferric-dicitrate binding protein FerR (iron transport regulator)
MKTKNTSYNQSPQDKYEVFFDLDISEKIKTLKVPAKITKEEAWENLVKSIDSRPEKIIHHNFVYRITAVAASILLAVAGFWYFNQSNTVHVISKRAEIKTVILPDSSKVYINAASTISYNPHKWDVERTLELNGEACFEVRKGKPFTVKTVNGTITVLGTRFNVMSRGNDFKVFCVTGKVAVRKENEVILVKGQRCTAAEKNQLTGPEPVNDLKPISWINGEFWFNNTPVLRVFEEIERQFGVDVIYNSSAIRNYTGYFNKNNLSEALMNVCEPMSLTYERNKGKIIIK